MERVWCFKPTFAVKDIGCYGDRGLVFAPVGDAAGNDVARREESTGVFLDP